MFYGTLWTWNRWSWLLLCSRRLSLQCHQRRCVMARMVWAGRTHLTPRARLIPIIHKSAREICIHSLPAVSLISVPASLWLLGRNEMWRYLHTRPCGDSSIQPYSFPVSSSFTSNMLSRARSSHVLLSSLHPLSLCRICSYSPCPLSRKKQWNFPSVIKPRFSTTVSVEAVS